MSPDVGHSFSNNITYYSIDLLIKRYEVEEAIRRSIVIAEIIVI